MKTYPATVPVAIRSVTPDTGGGILATSSQPNAKRVSPSRGCTWQLRRIRMILVATNTKGNYIVYTGPNNVGPAFCGYICAPVGGVWKNSIAPENEILWVGCVPPGKSSYEPQQSVAIGEQDSLVCATFDATDFFQDTGVLAGKYGSHDATGSFEVRFELDVDETILGESDVYA